MSEGTPQSEFLETMISNLGEGYLAARWCSDTHIWRILNAYSREFASGSAEIARVRDNLSMSMWDGWPSGSADPTILYNNYGVFVRQSKAFAQSSEINTWIEASGAAWPSYRQQIRFLWDAAFRGGTMYGARTAAQAMSGVAPFIDELYGDPRWVVPGPPSGSGSDTPSVEYGLIYSDIEKYDDFAWGSPVDVYAPSGSNDMSMGDAAAEGTWSIVIDSGFPLTTWVRVQGSGSFIPGSSSIGASTMSAYTEEKLVRAEWSRPLWMASGSGSFDEPHLGRPFALGDEVSGSFDIRTGSAPHRFLKLQVEMRRSDISVITPRFHGVKVSWLR